MQEEYLEYRQVPGSDPPHYEFLCGPKALTETSKTKVLQFLAKVKDSVNPALLPQYEEAWREEVESTGARDAARAGTSASTRPGTAASASLALLLQPLCTPGPHPTAHLALVWSEACCSLCG